MCHLIMSQKSIPGKTQTSIGCCRGRKQDKNTNWAEKRFEIFMGKTRCLTMFQLKIHALFFNIMVHVL